MNRILLAAKHLFVGSYLHVNCGGPGLWVNEKEGKIHIIIITLFHISNYDSNVLHILIFYLIHFSFFFYIFEGLIFCFEFCTILTYHNFLSCSHFKSEHSCQTITDWPPGCKLANDCL